MAQHTEARHNQNPLTSFLVAPRFFDVGFRHKTNRNKENNQRKWNKQWQTHNEMHKCQKKTKKRKAVNSEEPQDTIHTWTLWNIKGRKGLPNKAQKGTTKKCYKERYVIGHQKNSGINREATATKG